MKIINVLYISQRKLLRKVILNLKINGYSVPLSTLWWYKKNFQPQRRGKSQAGDKFSPWLQLLTNMLWLTGAGGKGQSWKTMMSHSSRYFISPKTIPSPTAKVKRVIALRVLSLYLRSQHKPCEQVERDNSICCVQNLGLFSTLIFFLTWL